MKHCLKSHQPSKKGVADLHPFLRFYRKGDKEIKHCDPLNTPALYALLGIVM